MSPTGGAVLPRDVVLVGGSESISYLQGQVSQDLDRMAVGDSAWSLVLQPTGKVDTWLRLHRVGEHDLVLDLDHGHGEAAVARLDRFKLRSDVTFRLETGWSMVSVRGSSAKTHEVAAELSAEVVWPGFEGIDHLGPGLTPPRGLPAIDPIELEALRIASGWPRLGAELTTDTVPAEGGQELLSSSVSFTKGCYTGQELVARMESRGGSGPRPIRVLVGRPGSGFSVGAAVTLDGAEVGSVTSAVEATADRPGLALAGLLRKVEPGLEVVVGDDTATVRSAPVDPIAFD